MADFASKVAGSSSVRVLARTMMLFAREFKGDNKVVLELIDEEGVAVHFGAPPSAAENGHDRFICVLEKTERLVFLEGMVVEMKAMGIPPEFINPLVDEATALARGLYPEIPEDSSFDGKESEALA